MKKVIWVTKLPTQNKDFDGLGYYSGFFAKNLNQFESYFLCQNNGDESEEFDKKEYPDSFVKRCFDTNKAWTWFNTCKQIGKISKEHKVKNIHVQYEFFSYASPLKGVLFLTLIGLYPRFLGLNVVVTLHQIPTATDVQERIDGGKFKANLIFSGIKTVFDWISIFANKLVVHESIFVERLAKDYGIKKSQVECIAHVSYIDTSLPKPAPKQLTNILDRPIKLLFFGYLSWYKGLDNLINNFLALPQEISKDVSLTLVGGQHPFQKKDPVYQSWLKEQHEKTKDHPNVVWYGFAKDEDVPAIFKSHSALVLPYKNVFSSSGPFAWATSFGLPVVVSGGMRYLTELGFLGYDTQQEFEKALYEVKNNQNELKLLSTKINQERGIDCIQDLLKKVYVD